MQELISVRSTAHDLTRTQLGGVGGPSSWEYVGNMRVLPYGTSRIQGNGWDGWVGGEGKRGDADAEHENTWQELSADIWETSWFLRHCARLVSH